MIGWLAGCSVACHWVGDLLAAGPVDLSPVGCGSTHYCGSAEYSYGGRCAGVAVTGLLVYAADRRLRSICVLGCHQVARKGCSHEAGLSCGCVSVRPDSCAIANRNGYATVSYDDLAAGYPVELLCGRMLCSRCLGQASCDYLAVELDYRLW